MTSYWAHAWPPMTAAFLASSVEFVEALTVIIAVGATRGWRGSLSGAGVALVSLPVLILVFRPVLSRFPLQAVQLFVGPLLLLFGLRWLSKAVLRGAGILPYRDENIVFAQQSEAMRRRDDVNAKWDPVAFAYSFKVTMMEGLEVVFIVIAVGAGGSGLLLPAAVGAIAALVWVGILGIVIHKPLAKVPDNAMKFIVGILLSAFGTFWFGEGIGITWPGGDFATILLTIAYTLTGFLAVGAAMLSKRVLDADRETIR